MTIHRLGGTEWSFILLVLFVVVNMFLAIVMGAYERIREDIKRYEYTPAQSGAKVA